MNKGLQPLVQRSTAVRKGGIFTRAGYILVASLGIYDRRHRAGARQPWREPTPRRSARGSRKAVLELTQACTVCAQLSAFDRRLP
jgi:hypothetical protein